jgi:hypothetical protein
MNLAFLVVLRNIAVPMNFAVVGSLKRPSQATLPRCPDAFDGAFDVTCFSECSYTDKSVSLACSESEFMTCNEAAAKALASGDS